LRVIGPAVVALTMATGAAELYRVPNRYTQATMMTLARGVA